VSDDRVTPILEALEKLSGTVEQPTLAYLKDTVQAAQSDIHVHVAGDMAGTLNVASLIVELDVIVQQVDLDAETQRAIRALLDDLRAQLGLPPDREKLPRLFVSYAHDDDSVFVERLMSDLVKAGFEVWWDRTHLPSRGVALPQELRDAILTQTDRLIAVVGPEAAKRGSTPGTNIALEWHTARASCKVIVPVLRGGSPDLPAHFLDRPVNMQAVKQLLLGGPSKPVVVSGQQKKVHLRGMGGIGKSVIAQALAFDCDVRRTFPDGVYWVRVGSEPSLLARLADLIESIGGFKLEPRKRNLPRSEMLP
jgi:hypothetical protein